MKTKSFWTAELGRKLGAEALGTALLLATVVGSGIMAETLIRPEAGGGAGSVALALLCNTVPTGAVLVVLISIFGPLSGAHFNPAVTFAFRLRGDIDGMTAILYVAAQIVGGVLGAWSAHLMFEAELFQISSTARTGGAQWFSEAVATFGLVLTILGGLVHAPKSIPVLVGLYITAAYWFTASTSFANPAVTIARSFTDTFSGIDPSHMPAFIGAQLIGAAVALFVAKALFAPQRA